MSPEISSVQGSVSQVRRGDSQLMQLATNIATFIVGQTKEANLAGPRTFGAYGGYRFIFEGERQLLFRILRAVKKLLLLDQ